ncbi:MAG: hypothetical protein ABW061_27615 [Polyangiaceae bacterium]
MIRGVWPFVLLAAGLLASCETNHSALEKQPGGHVSTGGTGGASAGSGPTAGGGAPMNTGGRADDEPVGTSRLTFVNGVVDAPSVAVCLGKADADGDVVPFGDPLTVLDYGHSVTVGESPDVDWAEDTLQLFLIAGDLTRIKKLDCSAAIDLAESEEAGARRPLFDRAQGGAAGEAAESAGSGGAESTEGGAAGAVGRGEAGEAGSGGAPAAVRSTLRVRGLPAISAGTLNQGRSLALVANGCMGGATYGGTLAEKYCGAGYTEQAPTISAVLVNLSRVVSVDHVGLQVVHASLASAAITVQTTPPGTASGTAITVASDLTFGQVGPRPASVINTVDALGSALKYWVAVSSGGSVLFSQQWSQVLAHGGLSKLENGHTYALVWNGPRGDLQSVPERWNAPTLTAIAVDPD